MFQLRLKQHWLYFVPLIAVILVIYHPWIFDTDIIARGDWRARSPAWMLDYLDSPSIWDKAICGGKLFFTGGGSARFPLQQLQAIVYKYLGLGFNWTERLIWFFPFLVIAPVSIFLLVKYLFKDKNAALFAALYFVSNNFVVFRLHTGQMNLCMTYALTPLALYFFIRALRERIWFFAFLQAVVLCVASYYELRIVPLIVVFQIGYWVYSVFFLAENKARSVKRGLSVFAVTVFCLVLANVFWLLPMFQSSIGKSVPHSVSTMSIGTIKQSLSRTGFLDALVSSIGADSDWGGFIYFDSQILTFLLIPVFLLVYVFSLLTAEKKRVYFWLGAAVLFALFAKGINPPFSFINALFYKYIPLAVMYRLPTKFLLVGATAVSICFGLGCSNLLQKLRRKGYLRITLACLLFLLPVLVIYPALFSSKKSFEATGVGTTFEPYLPSKYFEYDAWLRRQEAGYKMIILPGDSYSLFSSKYPRYFPAASYQKESVLGKAYYYYLWDREGLEALVNDYNNAQNNLRTVLAKGNIRYVFLAPDKDFLWPWHPPFRKELLEQVFSAMSNFLEPTELENVYIVPDALPNFVVSLGGPVSVENAVDPVSGVEINYSLVDNAHYVVEVDNAPKATFYLNFLDGYDSGWVLDGKVYSEMSSMGMNYFEVDNAKRLSTVKFELEHNLQKYVDAGWAVTQVFWYGLVLSLTVIAGLPAMRNWLKRR